MRNIAKHTIICLTTTVVCVLSGSVPLAHAGSIISLETITFGNSALNGTATVYLEKDRMRIDSTEGGGDVTVIYNGSGQDNPFYWLIDNHRQTYIQIREEELIEATRVMENAMDAARAEIEKAPPDQRPRLEQIYAERIGYTGFLADETEYREVSKGIKIGEWKCAHYQGYRSETKIEEVWAAELAELGIEPEDLSGLTELADLFRTVGQTLPAFFRFGGDETDVSETFPGFPVVVVTYKDGERAEKSTIKTVEQKLLEASLFELPEGLTQQDSPLGR